MGKITENDKSIIQSLMKSWISQKNPETEVECPNSDKIAAYAFDELEPEETKFVEAHVINCSKCLTEVADLREIKASTEAAQENAP